MTSISYLVTVYNKAACVPEVFEALKQQQGDFEREFIFVDDGSSDDSLAILQKLAPSIGAKVITQVNKGPSSAINNGLQYVTKEWVFLADGDDRLLPDTSSYLLSLIAQCPNAVLFRGKHSNNFLQDSKIYNGSKIIYMANPLTKALQFFPCCSSLLKTSTFKEVAGCDTRVFIQDYSPSLRMARKGAFVHSNKIIATNIDAGQDRLSSNKLRENQQTALARFLFIQDNLNLSYQDKYYAMQCHLRKAWKWHLKNNFSFKLTHFWRYIWSMMGRRNFSDQKILSWMAYALEVYK